MGGVQIMSKTLIVCALYFVKYYWVLNIYQKRLLGTWPGINPVGTLCDHYVAFSNDLAVSDRL